MSLSGGTHQGIVQYQAMTEMWLSFKKAPLRSLTLPSLFFILTHELSIFSQPMISIPLPQPSFVLSNLVYLGTLGNS